MRVGADAESFRIGARVVGAGAVRVGAGRKERTAGRVWPRGAGIVRERPQAPARLKARLRRARAR